MVYASVFLLTLTFAGCRLMSIRLNEPTDALIAVVIAIVATLPLPLYWHEKGKLHLRDAAFTLSWAFLLAACIPFTVAIAARAGAAMPLQDLNFAQLDQSMGVNVPHIMALAARLGISNAINHTYVWLEPFMAFSFLLPALTGKVLPARRFLTSNLIAFAIGLPLFVLFPAAGPWSGYHFPPGLDRFACEAGLLELRQAGPYIFHPSGVVCFPSFHVIWAMLAAHTLWGFRWLRVPALILAGLIILSTMTLGWHYFVDVLAGIAVAATAISLSRALPQ
jgi:membrane-associated phospholipid phosphatase